MSRAGGETEREKPAGEQGPTFEEALQQLETIVQALEEGRLALDQSLAHYEAGVKLLRRCHGLLERAERRIELLGSIDAQGAGLTESLDDRALSLDEKAQTRGRRRSKAARGEPRPGGDRPGVESGQDPIDDSGTLF